MSEFAQSFIAHLQRLQERDRGPWPPCAAA